jgi:16S rRNA (uracil1498-N3)-methyltransferase
MRIPRFYYPELTGDEEEIKLPLAIHRHAVQVLTAKLLMVVRNDIESPLSLTLIQGISRGDRMDYTLQKAVELGVNKIVPVTTERCNVQLSGQRAQKKVDHWQGVIISASEQSGRCRLPTLASVISFDEMLVKFNSGSRLILEPTAVLGFKSLPVQMETSMLIGPEGGFSDEEVDTAVKQGFQAIKFGPRILRTETAAVSALAVLQAMWGDLG